MQFEGFKNKKFKKKKNTTKQHYDFYLYKEVT